MKSLSRRLVPGFISLVILSSTMQAATRQFPPAEELPKQAELPDVLKLSNGEKVSTPKQWSEQRRPELKALFAHYMYGEIPPKPTKLNFDTQVLDKKFLGGKATLK